MPNSALAAYYNTVTGKRHIIYQSGEDKTLYDFSPQGNNGKPASLKTGAW
jgi:hypothetical protein